MTFLVRYAAENPVQHGAPRNSEHLELRQALAMEIWETILTKLEPGSKISVLTNGPLTNIAKLITSNQDASSHIQVCGLVILECTRWVRNGVNRESVAIISSKTCPTDAHEARK